MTESAKHAKGRRRLGKGRVAVIAIACAAGLGLGIASPAMGLWNDENGDVPYTLSQGEVGMELLPVGSDGSSGCALTYSEDHQSASCKPVTVELDGGVVARWSDGTPEKLSVSADGVDGSSIVYVPFSVNAMGEGNLGIGFSLSVADDSFLDPATSVVSLYKADARNGDACGGESADGMVGAEGTTLIPPSTDQNGKLYWEDRSVVGAPGGTEAADRGSGASQADTEPQNYCLVATPKDGSDLAAIFYQNVVAVCDLGDTNCKQKNQVNWWTKLNDVYAYDDTVTPDAAVDSMVKVVPEAVRPNGVAVPTLPASAG
jgi:hypothetical protein